MPEQTPNPNQDEQKQDYTPASTEKRVAAWMGIVYMLMFGFIITFSMYRPGQSLAGTFPLFLVPVAVAAMVIAIVRQRRGTAPGGLPGTILIVILCAAALAAGLWLGIPPLAAAFGG